ncbi:MAG: trans-sulfuration enzyme family protein [Thermoplasmata archaeon]
MNDERKLDKETIAIHGGEYEDGKYGNISTPIFESSVFRFPNNKKDAIIDKNRNLPFIYTRLGNPTIQSLEEKYAMVESAEDSLAFSSGMAAISSTLLTFLRKGDRLLSLNKLYGQTLDYIKNSLTNYGIQVDFITVEDLNNLNFNPEDYKMLFFESIVNPTMEVIDVRKIGKELNDYDIITAVDSTMSSPVNQRPYEAGIKIVIQSATKYISGHDDITFGFVSSSKKLTDEISLKRKVLGGIPDPIQSFLISRSLKTMFLRVRKQNDNALILSEFLKNQGIGKVNYPGVESFKYYNIARENLYGYGGVLSFDLEISYESAEKFMDNLKVIKKAPTFGGVESLITMPWETSHTYISENERLSIGITQSLLRLSVGIENVNDLKNDLESAINKI